MTPTDELIAAPVGEWETTDEERRSYVWALKNDININGPGVGDYTRIKFLAVLRDLDRALALLSAERDRADQAEAALWRIVPNVYTIEMEGGQKPDPFEGPGETYQGAYVRERARNKRLVEALVEADGCFEAALAEGWVDALAAGDIDRIRDIWQRRIALARSLFPAALAQPEEQR